MSLAMHNLKPVRGAKSSSKRVGRGNASGKGTYSARGIKGQKARTGGRGGLKRLGMRRILLSIPKKRGFTSRNPRARVVQLMDLERLAKSGDTIDRTRLLQLGLLRKDESKVKVLGVGRFTKSVTIKGIPVSEGARKVIEAAGGKVE